MKAHTHAGGTGSGGKAEKAACAAAGGQPSIPGQAKGKTESTTTSNSITGVTAKKTASGGTTAIGKGGLGIAREKSSGIYFKVSERERALIEQRMAQTRIRNMSGYIRKMCIDGQVINLNIAQFDEIGKLLRITANNVNQIAKRINSGGTAYREDVAEVHRQLQTIRANFGQVLATLAMLKKYTGEKG